MRKVKFYILFILVVLLMGIGSVKASDDGFINIESEEAFDECIKNQGLCRMMSNLNINNQKEIDREVVLDLNGYIIAPDDDLKLSSGLIMVNRGGKLTINDSKGSGKISTGSGDNVWAAIQVIKENLSDKTAEVIINGGTIEGYYYGITGNGNYHNSKITINGGKIQGLNKEDSAGIYHPQEGELIVNGGTIKGGSGIEIRAGNLTVNDGVIEGIASKFVKMVNKNGTTTNGVGIVVAQHVTKKVINVLINDGKIKGQYAFYEWNPHENSKEDLDKIKISITGGTFEGLDTRVHAVYSEDFREFISGGKFNTDVEEYLTQDAKTEKTVFSENVNNDSSLIIYIGIILLLIGVSIAMIILNKKNILVFR